MIKKNSFSLNQINAFHDENYMSVFFKCRRAKANCTVVEKIYESYENILFLIKIRYSKSKRMLLTN